MRKYGLDSNERRRALRTVHHMTLDPIIREHLSEVHARLGFRFVHEATRITLPELLRALRGEEVREETHKRLSDWVKERVEVVNLKRNGRSVCPTCGR